MFNIIRKFLRQYNNLNWKKSGFYESYSEVLCSLLVIERKIKYHQSLWMPFKKQIRRWNDSLPWITAGMIEDDVFTSFYIDAAK